LEILAFPSNQFGYQEPGTDEEILKFVSKFDPKMEDKIVFFTKGHVNGTKARPVFRYLKHVIPNEDGTTDIRWNFAKFLVGTDGMPQKRYGPKVAPLDINADIEELLKKRE